MRSSFGLPSKKLFCVILLHVLFVWGADWVTSVLTSSRLGRGLVEEDCFMCWVDSPDPASHSVLCFGTGLAEEERCSHPETLCSP